MALIATRLSNFVTRQSLLQCRCSFSFQQQRKRHRSISRRRQPSRIKTFQQRLDEISARDSYRAPCVNIGFPLLPSTKDAEHGVVKLKKKAREKQEFAARHGKLKLDLKAVREKWQKEQGAHHVCNVAEHYGLYAHLFGPAYFYNTTPMSVCYDYDEAFVTPVYYGNKIMPSEAAVAPYVSFDSEDNSLWTLVMTSPDGNLQHNDQECLHWMVTNIAGSDVGRGDTVCDYLQPFPVRGGGYLRYAFVLFRQQSALDPSQCHRVTDSHCLKERSFSTAGFYRKHRENLTPACLCFFQSRWDSSVTSVFHHVLKMKEPCYEYSPPPDYPREEKHCPQPDPQELEWYLDSYFGEDDTLEDWYAEELDAGIRPHSPLSSSSFSSSSSSAFCVSSVSLPQMWMKPKLKELRSPLHHRHESTESVPQS